MPSRHCHPVQYKTQTFSYSQTETVYGAEAFAEFSRIFRYLKIRRSTMGILCALAVLFVAIGSGSAQKISEFTFPNFSLNCSKPLVFSGEDDEAACFAKCTPGKCQAAVHMNSGQPGKPTCALIPAGAKCIPERGGPHTLKLNVPKKEKFSINKNHNIVVRSTLPWTLAYYRPGPNGRDGCFAFCQFLGCNAIQEDNNDCQLLKFTQRPEVMTNGKSPICHATALGFYENEKIAPIGDCIYS